MIDSIIKRRLFLAFIVLLNPIDSLYQNVSSAVCLCKYTFYIVIPYYKIIRSDVLT